MLAACNTFQNFSLFSYKIFFNGVLVYPARVLIIQSIIDCRSFIRKIMHNAPLNKIAELVYASNTYRDKIKFSK